MAGDVSSNNLTGSAVDRAKVATIVGDIVIIVGVTNGNTVAGIVGGVEPGSGDTGGTEDSTALAERTGAAVSRASIAGIVIDIVIGIRIANGNTIASHGRSIVPGSGDASRARDHTIHISAGSAVDRAGIADVVANVVISRSVTAGNTITSHGRSIVPGSGDASRARDHTIHISAGSAVDRAGIADVVANVVISRSVTAWDGIARPGR